MQPPQLRDDGCAVDQRSNADYDPTFDNEAIQAVGHLEFACGDVLEPAARRPPEEFAVRHHGRRTVPDMLPKIAAAATYLTTVLRHLEERIG